MPRIIGKDSDIVRRMFLQASQAVGCTAIYHELVDLEKDMYNDPTTKYLPPVTLEVLFDENPKVKMLRDFGWYNEDDEIRPLLMYLPIYKNSQKDLLNVQEHTLIELVYMGVNKSGWFRISAKRLDSLFGNYWICKCVPERRIEFIKDPTDGYFYLSVNRTIKTLDDSPTVSESTTESVHFHDLAFLSEEETLNIIITDNLSTQDLFSSEDSLSDLSSDSTVSDDSTIVDSTSLGLTDSDTLDSTDTNTSIGPESTDTLDSTDTNTSISQESNDTLDSTDTNTSIGQEEKETFYMDDLMLDVTES